MEIALMNNDLEAIEQFIDDGNRETIGNFLLKAAKTGSPEAVKVILDKMKSVGCSELTKVTNNLGNTALHEAAGSRSKHSEDIMDLLIMNDSGLLEIENEDRRTPLHLAAYGINHKSFMSTNVLLRKLLRFEPHPSSDLALTRNNPLNFCWL